jgi:hypothetical protein
MDKDKTYGKRLSRSPDINKASSTKQTMKYPLRPSFQNPFIITRKGGDIFKPYCVYGYLCRYQKQALSKLNIEDRQALQSHYDRIASQLGQQGIISVNI